MIDQLSEAKRDCVSIDLLLDMTGQQREEPTERMGST